MYQPEIQDCKGDQVAQALNLWKNQGGVKFPALPEALNTAQDVIADCPVWSTEIDHVF